MCCLHLSSEHLVRILHTCRKVKWCVLRLHKHIRNCGLGNHVSVGNYVVPMLVEAGCMLEAHQAFDRLVSRTEISWNALISGYVKCGMPHLALALYHDMQTEVSACPHGPIFVALLRACTKLKEVRRGIGLHAEIARIGLQRSDLFIGSSLVDMYAKIGWFSQAQDVFNELPARDIVLWTALLTGYVEFGCSHKVFECLDRMQLESVSPDITALSCSFKACGGVGDVKKAQELHARVAGVEPLEGNIFAGSALVDMYAKCGLMTVAEKVFDSLHSHNVVVWTALIAGYIELGYCEDAIRCFEKMQIEGVSWDAVIIACILKACGTVGVEQEGMEIHAEIGRLGLLEGSHSLGNALVHMYANFGDLEKAQEVFDDLPRRDIDSWNALIEGFSEQGYTEEAVECFKHMELENISPNAVTFACISKAYINIGALDKAKESLAMIQREDWLEQDGLAGSTLIGAYAQCGLLEEAQKMFDKLPARTIVTWNALIGCYAENGCFEEVFNCFDQMQHEGVFPDAATCICYLKACEGTGALERVEDFHSQFEQLGLPDRNLVSNTLLHVYAKCGSLKKAQIVFNSLWARNVASWTILIASHVEHGYSEEALGLFEQMQGERVPPDVFTYIHSLKACGNIGDLGKGEEIYAEIERRGLLQTNVVVGNSLLDMYVKCGFLARAQEVFDNISCRDVVTWNSLIAAHAEYGCGEEAINLYEQMQALGFAPDAITLVCILKACGSIGAKRKGWEVQEELERQGLIGRDPFVGSILVDIYAKWGSLEKAQQIFDILSARDVVSWNALMGGYAQFGRSDDVFWVFDRMVGEGVMPDAVTFVIILSTCRRTGLLTKSQTYFENMSKDYGIAPTVQHHNCMVNVLSHTGHLDKAVSVIEKMPSHPDLKVWHTFLSACRDWGSIKFGKQAFEDAVCLDEKDPVAYIMMSRIYAGVDDDQWEKETSRKVGAMS